ncbi:MAG TPA: hypothetical protein VGM82_08520 [Gemmatimonadaceae bacterium]|jgi:hypothetical protein
MTLKTTILALLAVGGGATAVAAQAAPARITLHIPSNIDVRAYAPDSARFSFEGADQIARGDTISLKDGSVLSYDRTSGPIHLLVRGLAAGQTVDITSSGERKSRWAAFVTHDVAISARGDLLRISPVPPMPVIVSADRDPQSPRR